MDPSIIHERMVFRILMRNLIFATLIIIPLILLWGYILYLLICALKTYIRSGQVRQEKAETKRSLGQTIKMHRTRCNMTQAFVAESLGVSRQAVSKWESGSSDPSTSNLIALAKLFGISPEELLREIQ